MAQTLLARLSRNRRDWARYIFADKAERDRMSRWNSGIEHAREAGIAIGEERGARNAKLETARNLLQMGLTAAQVTQATGLSEEEINTL